MRACLRFAAALGLAIATAPAVFAQNVVLEASIRPDARPDDLKPATFIPKVDAICGDDAIMGTVMAPIAGRIEGCGIAAPVSVTAVSGVPLSVNATMDCVTAVALKDWVDQAMVPAMGDFGGGVREITVVGHYSCRTRNNKPDGKISEHGKGHAIDIAGFTLGDGSRVVLLNDWDAPGIGQRLKDMHARACGIFGTVLGPESDQYHKDHFHFDTARYRSGAYCR